MVSRSRKRSQAWPTIPRAIPRPSALHMPVRHQVTSHITLPRTNLLQSRVLGRQPVRDDPARYHPLLNLPQLCKHMDSPPNNHRFLHLGDPIILMAAAHPPTDPRLPHWPSELGALPRLRTSQPPHKQPDISPQILRLGLICLSPHRVPTSPRPPASEQTRHTLP